MFPKERRRAMAAYIDAEGHATVEELAQRFSVSVDSIRKDLKVLAAEGLCRREYGGATRIDRPEPEPASEAALLHGALDLAEEDSAEHSCRAVAARAYMEIADGDAIFLDVSKTCLYIAELLAAGDKRCIVTTNMIDIPTVLAKNPKVTALATGGYLSPDMRGFTGPTTISLLEPLLFERAFVSCSSISLQKHAVMADVMDDGLVKQRAIENATYRFLLAEDWKFSNRAGYRFASIGDFTAVVTNESDVAVLGQIASMGIPTLC